MVLWRNSRGVAKYKNEETGKETKVVYGLAPGGADLIGIYAGRFLAIELKRDEHEQPTDEQKLFLALVRKKLGFACVVWSVEGFRAAMARAKNGENE